MADSRIGRALLKEKAQVVTFEKQSQRALTDWVVKHFQAVKKQISPETCAELIFQTGGSMTALAMEIEKLSAYTDAPVITKQDLGGCCRAGTGSGCLSDYRRHTGGEL